jgi:hypothetical protein
MKITLPFLLLLLLPCMVFGQSVAEKLQKYEGQYPIEKVYIAHDRAYYSPGDTIWCQAFLVEGRSHLAFDAAPILFVEWYNDQEECLRSMTVKIKNSSAAFEIPTGLKDSTGVYQLRAYTQYQRNFDDAFLFQKSILLTNDLSPSAASSTGRDFSVQFFPEGGDAIEGMKNKVAFKAIDDQGAAIEIDGFLRYKNGDNIQAVKSVHEGIGVFFWMPEKGNQYEFVGVYNGQEKTFDLPSSLNKGYTLSANNRDADYFELSIQASPGMSLQGIELLGHLRGQVFLSKIIEEEQDYKIRIPRDQVPSGLVHMTLFDEKKRPLAERLLFNRNESRDVSVSVNKNKTTYDYKDEVELDIAVADQVADQKAKLSVSVYNTTLVAAQKEMNNIQSYLWLQSDLKGELSNIHQYFMENSSKSRVLLDYVLLTHGWSRFKWQEIMDQEAPLIDFFPQENFAVAGRITKGNSNQAVKADVFLNILSEEQFSSLDLTTEDDGLFYFKGFDFTDTTNLVIQANVFNERKKGKLENGVAKRTGNTNVDVEIIDLTKYEYTPRLSELPSFTEQNLKQYAKVVQNQKEVDLAYSNLIQGDIAEVTIEASRLSLRQEREADMRAAYRKRGIAYSPSSKKLFMDDIANKGLNYQDFYELVGARFPGVRIDRSEPFNKKVFLSNANFRLTQAVQPAILVIDGMVIDQAAGATPPVFQPIDIEFLDLISPNQAQILYGEYAIGGAVVITLREEAAVLGDQSEAKNKGTVSLSYPGYYNAREFYVPDYSKSQRVDPKPDLRTTIYWNPQVNTGESKGTVRFYTGDQRGIYVIQIEGITEDGRPFVYWEEIEVSE